MGGADYLYPLVCRGLVACLKRSFYRRLARAGSDASTSLIATFPLLRFWANRVRRGHSVFVTVCVYHILDGHSA